METKELLSIAFKMTMALGVVLLFFGVSLYLFRRFSGATGNTLLKKSARGGIRPLEVLAYQSLGPGRGVYLLRCLDKKVLVGATQSNIQHISDVYEESDEDDVEEQTSIASREKKSNGQNPVPTSYFLQSLKSKAPESKADEFQEKIKSDLKEIARV